MATQDLIFKNTLLRKSFTKNNLKRVDLWTTQEEKHKQLQKMASKLKYYSVA